MFCLKFLYRVWTTFPSPFCTAPLLFKYERENSKLISLTMSLRPTACITLVMFPTGQASQLCIKKPKIFCGTQNSAGQSGITLVAVTGTARVQLRYSSVVLPIVEVPLSVYMACFHRNHMGASPCQSHQPYHRSPTHHPHNSYCSQQWSLKTKTTGKFGDSGKNSCSCH